jgi:hypothetical protein
MHKTGTGEQLAQLHDIYDDDDDDDDDDDNHLGCNMALGLTQPLTEMSTMNISWGKGGQCIWLTTFMCRLS